jgi:hypothetical protein
VTDSDIMEKAIGRKNNIFRKGVDEKYIRILFLKI